MIFMEVAVLVIEVGSEQGQNSKGLQILELCG